MSNSSIYSEIPFEPCDNSNQFPTALYGNRFREAKKSWKRIQIRAEKSGSWEEALCEEECVSLRDRVAPILMWRPGNDDRITFWHVYWIGELLTDRALSGRREIIDRLTILGLNNCWFALGVLSDNGYSCDGMRRSHRFLYEMLCRYVYWIPELRIYGRLYTDNAGGILPGESLPQLDHFLWQRQLVLLAYSAFPKLREDPAWERLNRSFYIHSTEPRDWEESDIRLMNSPDFEPIDGVEVLVRGGMIRECNGRYEVIHEPPNN